MGSSGGGRAHDLEVKTYHKPTFCEFCQKMIFGVVRQGFKCQRCRRNFHERCSLSEQNFCVNTPSPSTSFADSLSLPHTFAVHSYSVPTVCAHCSKLLTGIIRQGMKCRFCKVNVHKQCCTYLASSCRIEDGAITPRYATAPSLDLPMTERAEGWIVHFLLSDPQKRLRQYWVLDYGAINMFDSCYDVANPKNAAKRLQLSEIVSIALYEKSAINKKFPPHMFEIRTFSNVTYCVGETSELFGDRGILGSNGPERQLFRALTRILLGGPRVSPILAPYPAAAHQEDIYDSPASTSAADIHAKYDVQQSRFLGSGLFGLVYGGFEKRTRAPVAVKIIAKERFYGDGVLNLRFELERVRRLSHPCVARIDDICESHDRIYVVSASMPTNLNDMILSHKRLSDRVTRFLVVQILSGLKHIHSKGIVHSNLKPENVLVLDANVSFPQLRICDAGFARFIQDTRFVESVVGSEAYMAPEIVQRSGFDHTSDLYSVGVITYVALTGKVPSVIAAAERAAENGAIAIAAAARDVIKRLLELKIEDRMDLEEVREHPWFDCLETFMDLRNLEMKCGGERFLTHSRDDARFEPQLRRLNITDSFV